LTATFSDGANQLAGSRLPAAPGRRHRDRAGGPGYHVKKRILVVDDNPSMRDLLRLILEGNGYEVSEAPHGWSAIAQMQASLPDLVMTDMMMPIMDGEKLVRRLRSNSRTACVPILVLSANPNAREIASNADAVLGKPFNRASLLETVGSLLGEDVAGRPT
jgi:CheY-like chemotaxis protein